MAVTGSDKISGKCDACMRGKMHRLPFPQSTLRRADEILGRIHVDLGGPLPLSTPQRFTFFMIVVDDHSRCVFGKLLRAKSDAATALSDLILQLETQTGKRLKLARSDDGGEWDWLDAFCKKHGCKREKTVPHTPQQDGVSERATRTIISNARTMLLARNIKQSFWPEAFQTAIHIHNRVPHSSIPADTTPHEIWTGSKPDISYFREFGAPCWSWIPVPGTKLQARGERGVFMGYAAGTKGYNIWMPDRHLMLVRRDIVFDESVPTPTAAGGLEEYSALIEEDRVFHCDDAKNSTTQVPEVAELPAEDIESRPVRNRKPTRKVLDYEPLDLCKMRVNAVSTEREPDPRSLEEALASTRADGWIAACCEENASLKAMGVYEEVKERDLPPGTQIIGSKYAFRTKGDSAGHLDRLKARLVALGYLQKYGINVWDTFAPVAKYETLRWLLMWACINDWELDHVDVKTAYLHADLVDVVYLRPPKRFFGDVVWRLKKGLYGLKQSGRGWYLTIHKVYMKLGFKRCNSDWSLYFRPNCIISMSVDDLAIAALNKLIAAGICEDLAREFTIVFLGPMSWLLGMKVERERDIRYLRMSQEAYINQILANHGMSNCNPAPTPMLANQRMTDATCPSPDKPNPNTSWYRAFVGELMYLVAMTRPDLAYAARELAKFMSNPGLEHICAAKRVLRYLKGTKSLGISYKGDDRGVEPAIVGFSDSDWASHQNRKSVSGYVFFAGGGPISWSSKQQAICALSTSKAEYMATTHAAKQLIWTRSVCQELGVPLHGPTPLYCDNQGTVACTQNPHNHVAMKHIDLRAHFIRDCVNDGHAEVVHVSNERMVADVLTKALPQPAHERWMKVLTLTDDHLKGGC